MKIKKMTAAFGKLDHAVLTPGPGLTLIQAPNEGGKSTWNAFLRAMLYGFPARDRDKAGHLAEKNRYQPWSGAAMEGTLEVEWQGRDVTIVRGPRGGTPWGEFRACYTATQEPVPGMTGDNCGELLLGVSRAVFERTAFLIQDSGGLTPSAELEKRVAALASTGDEVISFTQVEHRLKDWSNRRRANSRAGLIPRLEEELDQVVRQRTELEVLRRQTQEARHRREVRAADCARLEAQLRSLASDRRAQAEADRDAAQLCCEQLEQVLAHTPEAGVLREAQGQINQLNHMRAEEAALRRELPGLRTLVEETRRVAQSIPAFREQNSGKDDSRDGAPPPGKPLILILLGLVLGGLAGWLLTSPVWLGPVLGAAVGCLLSVLADWGRKYLHQRDSHSETDGADGTDSPGADCGRLISAARAQEEKLNASEARCTELNRRQEEITAQLLDLIRPFAPEVKTPVGMAAALARALKQEEALRLARIRLDGAQQLLDALPSAGDAIPSMESEGEADSLPAQLFQARQALALARDEAAQLAGQLQVQGDPDELASREDALREELTRRKQEYEALALALDSLREADSQLRERFSPVLNRRAGEYLSALTGGAYEAAALTRTFQALARETGQHIHRPDLSLSEGTAQQLYLALRLALCDLVLSEQESCPIVLDDALDAFDDQRAALALDCLLDVARRRQVLLFTCHSREAALLRGRPVTLLQLG